MRDLPPTNRAAALEAIADEDVRREVASLLQYTGNEDGETVAAAIGAVAAHIGSQEDRRIGPYKLIRRVGQGGQGSVYEAVRDDGTFEQRVAIKIVKWDLDSELARERFRQERQILARLEHPYIARLLDGGQTEDGVPYLAMEFVDGEPLTAAAKEWPVKRKLELFLKVCQAVSYAHANLVIHRDLKPANILVSKAGDAKVVDFGIAKLLDPTATKTQTGFSGLTPDYASPEQIRGLPISIASDVYSLGVVLYQLLTERKPYTVDTSSVLEMDRVICRQPPQPPGLGDELDYILLMALRKEPERRYSTVDRFAEDIERYLTLRPVLARPDSTWYRVRKYVRRQRAGLAWAAIALIALLAGTGQAIRAGWRADAEAASARAINNFLKRDLLFQAGGYQQPDPNITVRTALDRAAERIGNQFAGQPRVESAVRQTIGESYEQLALYPEARLQLEKALAILQKETGAEDQQRLTASSALGSIAWRQGRLPEAEALLTDSMNRLRKTLGPDNIDTLEATERLVGVYNLLGKPIEAEALIRAVAESRARQTGAESQETLLALGNLAAIQYSRGAYSEAAQTGSDTLEKMKRALRPEDPIRLSSGNNLALSYLAVGRYKDAEDLFREIIEIRTKVQGADNPDTLIHRNGKILAEIANGKFSECQAEGPKIVERTTRLLGPDHPDTLAALRNLGACYQVAGQQDLAISVSAKAVEGSARILGPLHPRTISSMGPLGSAYAAVGRYQESEDLLRKAIERSTTRLGPDHPDTLMLHGRLATTFRREGKLAEAKNELTGVADGLRKRLGPDHPNSLLTAANLAYLTFAAGDPRSAEETIRPVLALFDSKLPDHWGRFQCQAVLGASLAAQNQKDASRPLLASGYQGLVDHRSSIPADSQFIIDAAREWNRR